MLKIVVGVFDALFVEAFLPDIQFAFELEGEASLDELYCFFERDVSCGCEQEVNVVRHYDEGVNLEAVLYAVLLENA